MKLDRWQTPKAVAAISLFLGIGIPWTVATASEFYSWIGPSGEMVLTDDAGKIPPAGSRGPLSVHRFRESTDSPSRVVVAARPSTTPERLTSETAEAGLSGQPSSWDPDSLEAIDPTALELSDVLLEEPDQSAASQYGWVPLSSPVYVGSAPLYGFWSRRTVQSPSLALQQHLLLLQQTKKGRGSPVASHLNQMGYGYPGYARQSTMRPASRSTSVRYQHSTLERQALLSTLRVKGYPVAHASIMHGTASSPSCCAQPSPRASNRRGSSRR